MIKIKIPKTNLSSPLVICLLYILATGILIMGFRLFFPGEPIPLAHFSLSWRLIQGFLEFINLFPALVLTSLVIPFSFVIHEDGKNKAFSPQFFLSFKMPIVTAIVAASLYGILFTLALPIARNYEANLLYQSRLYLLASEKAQASAARGEWIEAAQLLAICEKIWPDSPETSRLRIEADIRVVEASTYRGTAPYPRDAHATWPESQLAVSVADALAMAQTALTEERYFDAHWLATLGSRLALPNSPELATATRLAGIAWTGVNAMAPTARETAAFNNFRLKREGYEAMLGGEWVSAFYIFKELLTLTPYDPDVARYLAISEEGVRRIAFFLNDLELTLGHMLTGAIFSLPMETSFHVPQNRLVMRVSSLSAALDYAYGIDAEIMAFDRDGRPLWGMTVPYVKFLPLTLETGPALTVLLRALDRYDQNIYWAPEITNFGQIAPGNSEITLPVSWESFILLVDVRRGLSSLSTADLRRAADSLGACGYLPQVFEKELLQRFVRPLLFLPFSIFAIGLGWQYRPLKRPRYLGIPMLFVLPVVFNVIVLFARSLLNNLGVWAVISFGFATAALFFAIGIVIMLIVSLIVLASKPG